MKRLAAAVFALCACASPVLALSLPERYATNAGSAIIDITTGVAGTLTNTKAFGSGTSSGSDNVDAKFIKDPAQSKSIKVVIDSTAGASGHNLDWTISRKFFNGEPPTIGWWIYFPVATDVSGCAIMLTADNFVNYFQANLTGIQAKRDGWNFFAPHQNDFAVGAGTPSWATTFTRMRLQCSGNASTILTYYVGQPYAGFYARPQVSWTFDDNEASIFVTAQPILEAKGWKGTLFSQGQRIDAVTYGTYAQHLAWKSAGHRIFNHTYDHPDLTSLSAADAESNIAAGQAKIDGFNLTTSGPLHFAYPFGNFNDTVKTILRKRGYASARAVGGASFTPYMMVKGDEFDRYQVECVDLGNALSLAQAKAEVDQAIKYGGVVVFLAHALVGASPGASSWLTTDFQALVDYVRLYQNLGLLDVPAYDDLMNGTSGVRKLRQ